MIQARHGKALRALAKEFGIDIRTIRTWVWLYAYCGFQALGYQPRPGRPPCLSHDQMQLILATLRDKSPDQLQFEFAYRSLKIVRPWILDQFPVKLSLATVRRVLRRLGLTPQRPQFRSSRRNADAVRTGIAATYPALAQRSQERGALLLLADKAGTTSPRTPTAALRGAPGPDACPPANGGAIPAAHPDSRIKIPEPAGTYCVTIV